ncbi:MAG: DUF1624 domain-containing protein [Chloroflexi bacterium]|nr:DUF1624 domain-containing protein [Chloroflexota bacterium]MBT7081197.1 DUF1624 domain-containing protein [Chloroflexota bacterium]MBT7290863.1 DUF1624 domain-containing protein [Chloroflexota bacterium]
MRNRFWEIDCLRGIAILAMVFFHTMFDLNYYGVHSTEFELGFWWWAARIIAGSFIFIVGISMTINYSRSTQFERFAKRGARIFVLGMAITLATWIISPDRYVVFGILHFIGVAVILSYFFLRFYWLNLLLGIACIAIGIYLHTVYFSFSYLMWLGLTPADANYMDYLPLLPWFGVTLLGVFTGKLLYPQGQRRFRIPAREDRVTKSLGFLGKNSLLIYLVHQPVLFGNIYLISLI